MLKSAANWIGWLVRGSFSGGGGGGGHYGRWNHVGADVATTPRRTSCCRPRSSGTTEDAADDSNADPHGNDDGDNYPSYDQTHYEAC